MDKLISIALEEEEKLSLNPKDQSIKLYKYQSPLCIQIIPNVARIRIEKARAISAIRERKCSLQELIEECKNQEQDEYAADINPISYYKENIFNKEDYFLYRAVLKFYYGDYEGAIDDFKTCNALKSLAKSQNGKKPNEENKSSHMSSQTDLSDIGLCSFNTYEANYNIMLCYLFNDDKKNALKFCSKLIDTVPSKYKAKLYLIRGLLYQDKEDFDKCKKDFMKAYTADPTLSIQCLDLEKDTVIEPFSAKQRLCAKFPQKKLKLGSATIVLRPSFSIPFIKPPNMIPNVDEIQMKKELTLKHLGGIKPEAPWIKR